MGIRVHRARTHYAAPRMSEQRVRHLLELQRRAFSASPWHSVLGALDGITESVFFHKPTNHSGFPWMDGSICNIVYHLTGDKLVQCSSAFDNGGVTWDNLPISKTDIPTMFKELTNADEVVTSHLLEQTDETLSNKVKGWGGKSLSTEGLFLMLIEHDLYHAGQIRFARNLIEPRND